MRPASSSLWLLRLVSVFWKLLETLSGLVVSIMLPTFLTPELRVLGLMGWVLRGGIGGGNRRFSGPERTVPSSTLADPAPASRTGEEVEPGLVVGFCTGWMVAPE